MNTLNTMLAESLDKEMYHEPNSEEDELKNVIQQLIELLKEIKEEGSEDDIDATLQFDKPIAAFLIGEYLEGKPILPMIIEVMNTL